MAAANNRRPPGGSPSAGGIYKHVPKDLTEATMLGAFMSILCITTVVVLFFSETYAFLRTSVSTSLNVDETPDKQIRLNFNVSMHALRCSFASVDVWDSLGTNKQNVTANVDKWGTDRVGRRVAFAGRAGREREIVHEEHDETIEELIADGAYAKPLTEESFESFLSAGERQMIDFMAPWCKFCQRLAPTWEKLAREAFNEGLPMGIGTVDCTVQRSLCTKYGITGFPSILSFYKGEKDGENYHGDRTVEALKAYAKAKINRDGKNWHEDKDRLKRYGKFDLHQSDQVGCQLSGYIMVNRVPGNFHIEARSKEHTIDPAMTNLTHTVNELSFGNPRYFDDRKLKRLLDYEMPTNVRLASPFDGKKFVVEEIHRAHHHYMKVVPTEVDTKHEKLVSYQIVGQSQLVYYDIVNVPEARFSYDLSPMSVSVEKRTRKWYDYLTSLCAIIGGTYTTLGLIDAALYRVFRSKRRHK
mmetsp:Transcript_39188/g.85976  ORF Transcript_39188/g.85976 Transcript_39188/m.85976 type:complete len:471 (-) Transcript_39188:1551-2963(-)